MWKSLNVTPVGCLVYRDILSLAVCKISLEGQTWCSLLYYDNVSNLTFHASEAWMESNSFQCPGWMEAVISQVSRASRGHSQAIKKVTARPAQWQAEASQTHTEVQAYAHPCNSQLCWLTSSTLVSVLRPCSETKVGQMWNLKEVDSCSRTT